MVCTVHENCTNCPDNASPACPMFIWSMNYEQLSVWIKNEMKEQGISHQKMSDITGIPRSTVDAIVAGHQKDVGHYTLSLIVRVLMRRYLASSPCRSAAVAAKSGEMFELQERIKEYKEANATYRAVIADLRAQVKKYEAAAKKASKEIKA